MYLPVFFCLRLHTYITTKTHAHFGALHIDIDGRHTDIKYVVETVSRLYGYWEWETHTCNVYRRAGQQARMYTHVNCEDTRATLRTQLLTYEIIKDVFSLNRSLSGHTTIYKTHPIFIIGVWTIYCVPYTHSFFFCRLFVWPYIISLLFFFFNCFSNLCLWKKCSVIISFKTGVAEHNKRCPNCFVSATDIQQQRQKRNKKK